MMGTKTEASGPEEGGQGLRSSWVGKDVRWSGV